MPIIDKQRELQLLRSGRAEGKSDNEIKQSILSLRSQSTQQKTDDKNSGFLRTLARETVRPFAKAGKTAISLIRSTAAGIAATAIAALGDKEKAKQLFISEVEKAGQASKTIFGGEVTPIDEPKEAIGTGLEIGALLAPGGAGAKAVTSLGKIGVAAGRGAVSGSLIGAGSQLSKEEDTTFGQVVGGAAIGGVTGAVAGGLFQAASQGAQKVSQFVKKKLPERFYSTFFKTTKDDLGRNIKTESLIKLKKDNPALFEQFKANGIIRVDKSGNIKINPTLAEEALKRGMGTGQTGRSLEGMAEHSFLKQLELENAARNIVKNTTKRIDLGNQKKAYIQLLDDIADDFSKKGFGEQGFLQRDISHIQKLSNILKESSDNTIDANTALDLRRTIDALRNTTSFRLDPNLTTKQDVFKTAADQVRVKLKEVPGLSKIMTDYKFFIDSADSLIAEAARRGNNKIFGLFDGVVGGASFGAGVPAAGIGVLAIARSIQTAPVLLALARGLSKIPSIPGFISKGVPQIAIPTAAREVSQSVINNEQ